VLGVATIAGYPEASDSENMNLSERHLHSRSECCNYSGRSNCNGMRACGCPEDKNRASSFFQFDADGIHFFTAPDLLREPDARASLCRMKASYKSGHFV